MLDDNWLDRWLAALVQRCAGRPVLELGCGDGRDSAILARAGLDVVALDRSVQSIAHGLTEC